MNNLLAQRNADGILTITFNRPEKMNALNSDTLDEFEAVFRASVSEKQVRAIIITGMGSKAFVAGADIKEIQELTAQTSREFVERGQAVFRMVEQSPKPVIAAVNGFALGGGCELAMACHLRVGDTHAVLGLPEVSLGIIPGYGGTQRLAQIVGKGRALEIMMTGNFIKAEEGYRIGLLNAVVDVEQLMPHRIGLANQILGRSPVAVAMVLQAVDAFYKNPEGFEAEINGFVTCCEATDFKEGTSAFLEKRKPDFTSGLFN